MLKRINSHDETTDQLSRLISAAQEDKSFHQQLSGLLRLPDLQRASIINQGLHEMKLRGEPESIRQAFGLLISKDAAATALKLLTEK